MAGGPPSTWKMARTLAIRVVAAGYLFGVWVEGVGWSGLRTILPHWIAFFLQVAALFPRAAHYAIDYRAEGYVCETGEWQELDTRPYFPIDVDDKESRFQRVMFFYRRQKTVMHALDGFLVDVHNKSAKGDGIGADKKIGGVRLMSIRGPIPDIGAPLVRVHYVPLGEIPAAERKQWYQTKSAAITERCFGRRPRANPSHKADRSNEDESNDVRPSEEQPPSADPNEPQPKDEQP